MKTSNIIILSAIGIVASLNIWMVVDAKNKFVSYTSEQEDKIELIEISLPQFSHIVTSGDCKLNVMFSNKNSYSQSSENEAEFKVQNDTLFIDGESQMQISCNSIKSIEMYNNSSVNIEDIDFDFLLVSLRDNSKFVASNAKLQKMDIYSNEQANVIISRSNIDTTNILGKGNSRIGLRGQLSVVRGDFYGESHVSVTGAINTQFSKNENASVRVN